MYKLIKNIEKSLSLGNPRLERKIKVNKYQIDIFKNYFFGIGFYKKYPDKQVNSIYFDNENLDFARSNINGELYRLKPRIRWYNKNTNVLNNEFKIKVGFNSYKAITNKIFNTKDSLKENIKRAKKYYSDEFNLNLKEIISIKYRRSYLEHISGVRLTVDQNIFSKKINNDKHYLMPYEVIEFKYKNNLDNYFRSVLFNDFKNLPLRMTKCSKYVECLLRII